MKKDKLIALILFVFTIWWAYLTTHLPGTTMPGEPGPKFFPSVILGLMAFFSILLFLTNDPKKTEETKSDENEKEESISMKEALKLFAVFLGGIIIVYYLGFNIGMIVSLTTMLWLIGWKILPRAILFSASVTLATYLLFKLLLRIPLPSGSIF